ncbi:hypothetical protein GCM10019059_45360 [Camelimonas fluminis]|uniref:Uncharacterized protein n=2 Tax=Camelimonas fluminis TaxID=1576911 RepID=A0ABV7UAY1_9HYPH|nr:hypothetical protein GCM10019059_45360 [Camelimonas fluminis]
MTDATTLEQARELAGQLERREHFRHGGTRTQARERLARRLGVLPGTLYNLARDRLKRFDNNLRLALTNYAIRDLQSEIEGLTHELEMARQMGAASRPAGMERIEARLAQVKALMGEATQ